MRDNQVGCPLRLPRLIITRLNVYINTAYQPLPSEQSMIEGWEREGEKKAHIIIPKPPNELSLVSSTYGGEGGKERKREVKSNLPASNHIHRLGLSGTS